MDIHLTNEQARWLEKHLDVLLDDAHWGYLKMDSDQKEHAQTIQNKIRKELDSKKW